jgi:hypothetical protein
MELGANVQELGNVCAGFSEDELQELREVARLHSEAAGLVIKLAGWAGEEAHKLVTKIPASWQARVEEAADLALRQSYELAAVTQPDAEAGGWLNRALAWTQGERWHQVATGVTGAVGGFGGLATALMELPVTTTLILRSIQEIAAAYGEDLRDEAVRAQCLGVFGFAGPLTGDDDMETGLFATRLVLTGSTVAEILKVVLPRFGLVVGEKLLAQATPVLGAAVAVTLNTTFTGFYQTMAHVHFRLRKLERQHDDEQVRACFERIAKNLKTRDGPASRKQGHGDSGGRLHTTR